MHILAILSVLDIKSHLTNIPHVTVAEASLVLRYLPEGVHSFRSLNIQLKLPCGRITPCTIDTEKAQQIDHGAPEKSAFQNCNI
jgi:hypothetical protein